MDWTDFLPIATGAAGATAGSLIPGVGTAAGLTGGVGIGTAIRSGLALRDGADVPEMPAEMKSALAYRTNLGDEYTAFTGASPTMTQNVYQREREQATVGQQAENTLMSEDLDMLGQARAMKFILQKTESMNENVENDLVNIDLQSESARLQGMDKTSIGTASVASRMYQQEMARYEKIQAYEKEQAEVYGQIAEATSALGGEIGAAIKNEPTATDKAVAEDSGAVAAADDTYDELTDTTPRYNEQGDLSGIEVGGMNIEDVLRDIGSLTEYEVFPRTNAMRGTYD